MLKDPDSQQGADGGELRWTEEWLQGALLKGGGSGILACRIPWTEEPGGLLSIRLHRVGHD